METKYIIGEKASMRDAYGNYLAELGEKYENIFVLDADLGCSTKADIFGKKFPERYRNVGISESFMQTKAAGIASEGYKVFTNTFAVFVVKGAEKIKQSVAVDKRDVKIIGTHGGIAVGPDGSSHQGINDISLMRSIPGIYVFCPADAVEVESMLDFMMTDETPTYMRITRNKLPTIHGPDYVFSPGKTGFFTGDHAFDKGDKTVTILSYGDTLHTSVDAAKWLKRYYKINAFVVNMPSIKPLDRGSIEFATKESDMIVTVEDHVLDGGLDEAVSREVLGLSSIGKVKKLLPIGLESFAESGSASDLYKKYGLDAEGIKSAVVKKLRE
ncbi:MAG: transketolase family protein [Candidatus Aenigmarchaeota archaeon]|nr:transketolase family protein [Candidatus Aenigmarchaeota archaeon]